VKYKKWLSANTESLSGKTVAITGSTGGLGKEICRYVLYLGGNLLLIDRNIKKSSELEKLLKSEYPAAVIDRITADLSDIASVKNACESIKHFNIDVLILNAAAYSIERKICDTGFLNVFQINFVSHYYLLTELLPLLSAGKGRVVALGSIAHNYSKSDACSVDFSDRKRDSLIYGNSKRYLMFSLYELFKNRKDVSLSVVHPGITFTNITSHYPKALFFIIKYPMKLIFMKPKRAALSVIKGIFTKTEYHSWIGPRFFNIWGFPSKKKLNTCTVKESETIFRTTQEIFDKKFNINVF